MTLWRGERESMGNHWVAVRVACSVKIAKCWDFGMYSKHTLSSTVITRVPHLTIYIYVEIHQH